MHRTIQSLPQLVLLGSITLTSYSAGAEIIQYNTDPQGNYQTPSGPSKINSNGRFVAYVSGSHAGNYNLWLWDRAEDTRDIVAGISIDGQLAVRSSLHAWDVSDDGRYVAFSSPSATLVPGDTNGHEDIFLRNLSTGETRRVNVTADGEEAQYPTDNNPVIMKGSFSPKFTDGGKKIIYSTNATNLSENPDPGYYIYDIDSNTSTRLPNVINLFQPPSPAHASADGKTLVVQDEGKAVILDVSSGQKTQSPGVNDLSANGRFATHFAEESAGVYSLHIYDHRTKTTSPVTVPVNGANIAVKVASQSSSGHQIVSISGDGRYVAFTTRQKLVSADTNSQTDAYVYDRREHRVALISVGENGIVAYGINDVWDPEISEDGHYISFKSYYNYVGGAQDGWNRGYVTTNPLYEPGYCAGYTEFGTL